MSSQNQKLEPASNNYNDSQNKRSNLLFTSVFHVDAVKNEAKRNFLKYILSSDPKWVFMFFLFVNKTGVSNLNYNFQSLSTFLLFLTMIVLAYKQPQQRSQWKRHKKTNFCSFELYCVIAAHSIWGKKNKFVLCVCALPKRVLIVDWTSKKHTKKVCRLHVQCCCSH